MIELMVLAVYLMGCMFAFFTAFVIIMMRPKTANVTFCEGFSTVFGVTVSSWFGFTTAILFIFFEVLENEYE